MAGSLTISTLKNDTGVLSVQNGMTGIAKAWVQFNSSTSTINASFNVGSITKNGVGNFTINFTTAMPSANYVFSGSADVSGAKITIYGPATGTPTTASNLTINISSGGGGSALTDAPYCGLAVFAL